MMKYYIPTVKIHDTIGFHQGKPNCNMDFDGWTVVFYEAPKIASQLWIFGGNFEIRRWKTSRENYSTNSLNQNHNNLNQK